MHSKVGDTLLLDTNQVGFLSRSMGFTVGTEGGHMGHGSHGGGTHPWQAEERAHKRQQTHDELVHVEPRAFLKLAFLLVQNHSGQNRQPLGYFLSLQYSLSAPLVCFFQLCVCVCVGGGGGVWMAYKRVVLDPNIFKRLTRMLFIRTKHTRKP